MFQRALGNKSVSALFKATVSGMLLPICSCGVIPLGLGLYYSGAYLGPVLAFMVATPIINPAAVILFWMMSPSLWSKGSLFPSWVHPAVEKQHCLLCWAALCTPMLAK
jgi:hypothetical protein